MPSRRGVSDPFNVTEEAVTQQVSTNSDPFSYKEPEETPLEEKSPAELEVEAKEKEKVKEEDTPPTKDEKPTTTTCTSRAVAVRSSRPHWVPPTTWWWRPSAV